MEGRTYLTRTSSGGFDLNRDNFLPDPGRDPEHGQADRRVEPCQPHRVPRPGAGLPVRALRSPPEPGFQYDLLAEHLMGGGEALGIAAVANNGGHNSYVIPQRDYLTYTGAKTADGDDQTQWLDPLGRHVHQLHPPVRHAPRHRLLHRGGARL